MRTPRVHTDTPLAAGQELSLGPTSVKYVAQVLRLRANDRVLLFNGDGYDYPATLVSCRKNGVVARTGEPGPIEPEPALRIHLAIGISRGERMDFALQKAVELGVVSITPLMTARSTVRLDGKRLISRIRHWRGITISACEQTRRRRLPVVEPVLSVADWLRDQPPVGGVLLDHRSPIALPEMTICENEITFLVGPEGGLTESERSAARTAGFAAARLGPRILRTETAPIAAIAVAQALWGDFR